MCRRVRNLSILAETFRRDVSTGFIFTLFEDAIDDPLEFCMAHLIVVEDERELSALVAETLQADSHTVKTFFIMPCGTLPRMA